MKKVVSDLLFKCAATEEARTVYQDGLEATIRSGDQHAKGEMQAALDMLG